VGHCFRAIELSGDDGKVPSVIDRLQEENLGDENPPPWFLSGGLVLFEKGSTVHDANTENSKGGNSIASAQRNTPPRDSKKTHQTRGNIEQPRNCTLQIELRRGIWKRNPENGLPSLRGGRNLAPRGRSGVQLGKLGTVRLNFWGIFGIAVTAETHAGVRNRGKGQIANRKRRQRRKHPKGKKSQTEKGSVPPIN